MREKGIDKYANATTSTVYTIRKQQCNCNRILEKVKPRKFYFKKARVRFAGQTSKRNMKQNISGKISESNKTVMKKFLKNLSFEVDVELYKIMYKINAHTISG